MLVMQLLSMCITQNSVVVAHTTPDRSTSRFFLLPCNERHLREKFKPPRKNCPGPQSKVDLHRRNDGNEQREY